MSPAGCTCEQVDRVREAVQAALDLVEDAYRPDSMLLTEVRGRLSRAVTAVGTLRTPDCWCRVAS